MGDPERGHFDESRTGQGVDRDGGGGAAVLLAGLERDIVAWGPRGCDAAGTSRRAPSPHQTQGRGDAGFANSWVAAQEASKANLSADSVPSSTLYVPMDRPGSPGSSKTSVRQERMQGHGFDGSEVAWMLRLGGGAGLAPNLHGALLAAKAAGRSRVTIDGTRSRSSESLVSSV